MVLNRKSIRKCRYKYEPGPHRAIWSVRNWQTGVSLLEVLASILIFSIGLLGYAAVQTRSLKESYDLKQRTIVLWESQALVDRIRANRSAIDTYIGKIGVFDCNDSRDRPTRICSESGTDKDVASCTADEIAEYDSWDVICHLPTMTIGDEDVNNSPLKLSVSLRCARESAPCPPGEGLLLTYNWASKSVLDNPNIADSTHAGQQYQLEFMP